MTGYQKRSWGTGANPFVLNIEELATIWHFPPITIKAPLVKKSESKRAEPPSGLPITYLEETLPGYVPQGLGFEPEGLPVTSEIEEGLDVPPPGLTFEPVSDEPLPETLPHPSAPTQQADESPQTVESSQTDETVPSNLPI